jgi:hypothetical protein
MTRDEIFARLREALVELFELDPKNIVPQASLMADLDLDSIDAIDLMLKSNRMRFAMCVRCKTSLTPCTHWSVHPRSNERP